MCGSSYANAIYFHCFFWLYLLNFWIWFVAHPWVKEGGEASEVPIDISVLNNMRQFVKFSRLKQIALRVIKKEREIVFHMKVFEFFFT